MGTGIGSPVEQLVPPGGPRTGLHLSKRHPLSPPAPSAAQATDLDAVAEAVPLTTATLASSPRSSSTASAKKPAASSGAETPATQWELVEQRLAKVTQSIVRCRREAVAKAHDDEDDDEDDNLPFYLDMKRKLLEKLRRVLEDAPRQYDVLDQLLHSVTQSRSRVRKATRGPCPDGDVSRAELERDLTFFTEVKGTLRAELQGLMELV